MTTISQDALSLLKQLRVTADSLAALPGAELSNLALLEIIEGLLDVETVVRSTTSMLTRSAFLVEATTTETGRTTKSWLIEEQHLRQRKPAVGSGWAEC